MGSTGQPVCVQVDTPTSKSPTSGDHRQARNALMGSSIRVVVEARLRDRTPTRTGRARSRSTGISARVLQQHATYTKADQDAGCNSNTANFDW